MENPNNNNYILARWRDANTDPPPDAVYVQVRNAVDGRVFFGRTWKSKYDTTWQIDSGFINCLPGDQWLDVTDIPAVPRAQVQAAVDDLIASSVLSDCDCPTCDAIRAMCKAIGVTPSEENQ